MSKLEPKDILNFNNLGKANEIFYVFLKNFIRFKKVRNFFKEHSYKEGKLFVEAVINELSLSIEVSEADLKKIPSEGGYAIVANYPLGGLEALILFDIVSKIRNDFKIVSSARFHNLEALSEITIPATKQGKKGKEEPCMSCAKEIIDYMRNGGILGFFPATGVAGFSSQSKLVLDKQWNEKLIKMIKLANVPVIPVFFRVSYGRLFHILGNLHPILQSFMVEKELLKKKDSQVGIRIGKAIKVSEQAKFKDIWNYTRFLRARVYALAADVPMDVNKFFKNIKRKKPVVTEPIVDPVSSEIIEEQIENAKKDYLLHKNGEFEIICAPVEAFPDVLTEIGRLREITFREVGEGTNKSIDLDEYDLYYRHLVIWDNEAKKIVGSYRIGLGDKIIEQYSIKGFYVSSLFKIKKAMKPVLTQTLEMGRSFIVKEYQRKPLSLFLLWKGIFYFLLKNPQYRYMIGPVSISQKFTELSKNLIVSFFEKYYFDRELAKYVKPRKKYKVEVSHFDKHILLESIGNDLNKLDQYIKEIEPDSGRMPVLFKKYFGLGAKILAFNVDPDFNNCLDGLIIVDVFNTPEDVIKTFAKDLDDPSILERFSSTE